MLESEHYGKSIFRLDCPEEYQKASASNLIELKAPHLSNNIYIEKRKLEILCYGIHDRYPTHIFGPSGVAKSSLISAVALSDNWAPLCENLGLTNYKPIKLFGIQLSAYESGAELMRIRGLDAKRGTFWVDSPIVEAIEYANTHDDELTLIWIKELGRTSTSGSVQRNLVNLIDDEVILPDGRVKDGRLVSWITDSNYFSAESSSSKYLLEDLDTALDRRLVLRISLEHLDEAAEISVLQTILENDEVEVADIKKVVRFSNRIRAKQAEGELTSLTPPSLGESLKVLRLINRGMSFANVILSTIAGGADRGDKKRVYLLLGSMVHDEVKAEESTFSVEDLL